MSMALVAAASVAGSWCVAIGFGDPGVVAMGELGVDLDHLAIVPRPGHSWAGITATALDGVDVVPSDLAVRGGRAVVVSGPNAGGKKLLDVPGYKFQALRTNQPASVSAAISPICSPSFAGTIWQTDRESASVSCRINACMSSSTNDFALP